MVKERECLSQVYLINFKKVLIKKTKKMEKVINYLTGFFGGLMAVMMSILPVTILWYVLTGGDVWGMDVITNLQL